MRRQQRKLNFLITQTELYAHFMARKMTSGTAGDDDDDVNNSETQAILSRLEDATSSTKQNAAPGNGLVDMVADDYG